MLDLLVITVVAASFSVDLSANGGAAWPRATSTKVGADMVREFAGASVAALFQFESFVVGPTVRATWDHVACSGQDFIGPTRSAETGWVDTYETQTETSCAVFEVAAGAAAGWRKRSRVGEWGADAAVRVSRMSSESQLLVEENGRSLTATVAHTRTGGELIGRVSYAWYLDEKQGYAVGPAIDVGWVSYQGWTASGKSRELSLSYLPVALGAVLRVK